MVNRLIIERELWMLISFDVSSNVVAHVIIMVYNNPPSKE